MSFIGVKLSGFCNGFFGHDDYDTKVIIFEGNKFVVVLYNDGTADVANFDSEQAKIEYLRKWIEEGLAEDNADF